MSCRFIALASILTLAPACDDGRVTTDDAPARYLVADGTWLLDDREQSFADARNPRRLELETSTVSGSVSVFSFFADAAGRDPIAQGCIYQYNRSQPDSYRFPESKGAIWVLFELQEGSPAACVPFRRVGFAPTLAGEAGDDRLHVRYGDLDYAALVGPGFSDPASPDLWWSVYRPSGTAPRVPLFPYEVANGLHLMDPTDPATVDDPRNPAAVEMTTSDEGGSESRFVFYEHGAPDRVWADCNFQVRYTMPDPSAFPADKVALWDAFEMTGTNSGQCAAFQRVVLFWTRDDGALHLRYGTEGFEDLLGESLATDPSEVWWPRYCPADATDCGR
jgi:hypothetical protein